MATNTDVLGVLEDARTRLEIAAQAAGDAEAEAQALLEFLQHESAEWSIAMSTEADHVSASTDALAQRWSSINDRLRHLGEQLTSEYAALHQHLDSEMSGIVATWSKCAERLPEVTRHVQDHEQACQTSQDTHHGIGQAGTQGYSDAIAFAESAVISASQELSERNERHCSDTQSSITDQLAAKQQRMKQAVEESREQQQSTSASIAQAQANFNTDMTAEVDRFEAQLTADVDALKTYATDTAASLKEAVESIGTLVGTLSEGAEDVIDVTKATNVGLNTVVGIVHTGVEICDEIIESFNA